MARELQRHPVRGSVTHVDFQVVDPNREVTAEVTITLTGEALELHRADGVLEQQMFSLTIKSRPADIPAHLEVDISDLVIGSAVRVSDIALPADVITEVDPDADRRRRPSPRVCRPPRRGAAEGEAAEGEAAEGEAGARRRSASAEAGGRVGRGELTPAAPPGPLRPGGGGRPAGGRPRQPGSGIRADPSQPRRRGGRARWRRATAIGCGPRRGPAPSVAPVTPGTSSSSSWPCPRPT